MKTLQEFIDAGYSVRSVRMMDECGRAVVVVERPLSDVGHIHIPELNALDWGAVTGWRWVRCEDVRLVHMTAQEVGRLLQRHGVKKKRDGKYKYYFVPPFIGG